MREIRVRTWEEFEEQATTKIQQMVALQSKKGHYTTPILFRGQANAEWGLTTTLQRATGKDEETATDYHHWMQIVHNDITSFLDKRWDTDAKLRVIGFEVKGIAFMVYLRQNGFPSPLLDWTQSPYIAAYFAFRDAQIGTNRPEYVCVYTYEQSPMEGEEKRSDFQDMEMASVHTIGPCLATDKKHHLQQCQYTLCMSGESDDYRFAEYPDEITRSDTRPCVIEKYIIPLSEQKKVLRRLHLMNITAFSLFGTEAALIESLAIRELFLEGI